MQRILMNHVKSGLSTNKNQIKKASEEDDSEV